MHICGLRGEGSYYSKPVILEIKDKKIGILGYNWVGKDKFHDTDQFIAQSHDSLVNYTWIRDRAGGELSDLKPNLDKFNTKVLSDIEKLRHEVDFVILLPHWGYEFVHYPPYGVIKEARHFVSAGVDLIIGSHPHVIQGKEKYKGKWIFYSLGNFVFDMRMETTKLSVLLDYELCETVEDHYNLKGFYLNKNFQPVPVNNKQNSIVAKIIQESSEMIASDNSRQLLEDNKVYREFEQAYKQNKISLILYHFKSIPRHPSVIKLIIIKIFFAMKLFFIRLKGQKIRW